jgi:hypothetical protein
MDQADVVFESLKGPDGQITRENFRAFFLERFPAPAVTPVAPLQPAVVAEVTPMLDLVADEPSATRQKKRALSDNEEEDWEADAASDSFALSPAEKKPKSKKAASASKGKKAAPVFTGATVTKAVRTARLKAVVASLKQGVKAKKFYSSAYSAFGSRVVACNAELSIVPHEFEAIFGNVGQLVPTGKAKSTVITRNLSTEEVVELLGPYASKIKVPTFSEPRSFHKQQKMASEPLILHDARVVYSTNLQKAKFTIQCSNGSESVDDDHHLHFGFPWLV